MKTLSLYIDKWYILAATTTEGSAFQPAKIALPNRETRIWLYFHEEVADNTVQYGRGFEKGFRDREPHYYGDVFNRIIDREATYTLFGRAVPLAGIFKSADIFKHLREGAEARETDVVPTFISFSRDISPASRHVFLELMRAERFDIRETVARIGHLALEYAARREALEDGHYLVLNACNENFHYSLYQCESPLFVRIAEDVLTGMGTDARRRAILEQVIDKINELGHIFDSNELREQEAMRLERYVDDWLIRLGTQRGAMPKPLGNVFCSINHTSYPISVKPRMIEERTERIVEDIIGEVTRFVSQAGVQQSQIKGVVMIGDAFTNPRFKEKLLNRYAIPNERMLVVRTDELPSVVATYTWIDLTQFSAAGAKEREGGAAALLAWEQAQEEAAAQQRAEEEINQKRDQLREDQEKERKVQEARDKGFEAERRHDYAEMIDFFKIVLTYHPDDAEAAQKVEEGIRLQSQAESEHKNYLRRLQLATKALDEADYETAERQAEEALLIRPDSKEAQGIKSKAHGYIEARRDFDRYIDRADLFFSRHAYDEALGELDKASLLNVDRGTVSERIDRIRKAQKEDASHVDELKDALQHALEGSQYDNAIKVVEKLIDADAAHARTWSLRLAEIKQQKQEAKAQEKALRELREEIEKAHLQEDWVRLATFCRKALAIAPDDHVLAQLNKAEERIAIEERKKKFEEAIAQVNALILEARLSEAKNKLSGIKELNEDEKNKVKQLRALIFNKEEEIEAQSRKPPRPTSHDEDWDWGRPAQPSNKVVKGFTPQSEPDFFDDPPKPRPAAPKQKDDFFDRVSHKKAAATGDPFFDL